ncbi:ABC transporter [Musa troglodytarum]|uniref:ABC transporter n=1 Tax=Musa troglodytarum TaxID=320322 RepID=A0A9E7EHL9_9LILI|nr:ABC transporter [Musa troglodytarum]
MESSSSYSSHGAASFFTQANVLHRKNLTFQKRNLKTNIGIVAVPIFLCAVIILIQNVVEAEMKKDMHQCGCQGGVCGIQYSSLDQFDSRPISSPFEWPVFLQVPRPESRAVTSDHPTTAGLPDESCKVSQSWPALVIFTGGNQSFAQILAQSLFPSSSSALNLTDFPNSFSTVILGTDTSTGNTQFMEPAFVSDRPLNLIQPQCTSNATSPISFKIANRLIELGKIFSCREQDYTIKQLNEPIEVKIFEWNTGGLLTRIEGLRAFLPKAELMNRIKNFTDLKDNDMMNLKEGTLLEGTMCKILPFGAQIRIGATNRRNCIDLKDHSWLQLEVLRAQGDGDNGDFLFPAGDKLCVNLEGLKDA